jgi:predicted enzyme related to lactoylglutathione lyase
VQSVSFDSRRPAETSRFWAEALGWRITEEQSDEVVLEPPVGSQDGLDMLFLLVPEQKSVKNRVHLDLRPDDQAAEVTRLEALGARRVEAGSDNGTSWVLMADPEGNEFSVLRALA